MADKKPKETLVEDGTELEGNLASSCPVVVRGTLSGTVRAPQLTVADSGVVKGDIKVDNLQSSGVLAGSIDADVIALGGEVHDDTVIRARSLEVRLAAPDGRLAVRFGSVTLEIGDDPLADAITLDKTELALDDEAASAS